MKKVTISGILICLAAYSFAVNSTDEISGSSQAYPVEIPQEVLSRFFSSFIIDDNGKFTGAMVGEMRTYISIPEILALISAQGYKVERDKIIDRHKPRLFGKGCKYNENWICQFDGSLVD